MAVEGILQFSFLVLLLVLCIPQRTMRSGKCVLGVKRPLCQGSSDPCAKGQATLSEEVRTNSADGAAGEEAAEATRDEGPDCFERSFEHASPINV